MPIDLVRSAALTGDAPYAYASVVPSGGPVLTAGACPLGEHDAPSTLLGVAMLGYPGQLVEVDAVAAPPA
jgi:hypothetical protein